MTSANAGGEPRLQKVCPNGGRARWRVSFLWEHVVNPAIGVPCVGDSYSEIAEPGQGPT